MRPWHHPLYTPLRGKTDPHTSAREVFTFCFVVLLRVSSCTYFALVEPTLTRRRCDYRSGGTHSFCVSYPFFLRLEGWKTGTKSPLQASSRCSTPLPSRVPPPSRCGNPPCFVEGTPPDFLTLRFFRVWQFTEYPSDTFRKSVLQPGRGMCTRGLSGPL